MANPDPNLMGPTLGKDGGDTASDKMDYIKGLFVITFSTYYLHQLAPTC